MPSEEIDKLIEKGEKLLREGKKEEARSIFIKAVRLAEEVSEEVTGLERFKIKNLISKLNIIIKEIDEE